MNEINKVTVKINGSDYSIVGPKSEEHMLKVAKYVDQEIRKITTANPKLSISSASILSAVNIANELFECGEENDDLFKENEELKKKNSELESQLRELEMIKAENTQLQQYMHLSDKYANYNTVPAYVINRDVSNFSSTLVLNVGTNDGIEEKMTVIADKGLVGYVISVTPTTCKVQVIIDSACTVSSMISTTQESIICKGTLENEQILRASYIPTGAELIQGDNVYTSGVGGIYPKGIIIGTIKDIITTSNITDRYATVEPAVDFSKLDTVLIIIDK